MKWINISSASSYTIAHASFKAAKIDGTAFKSMARTQPRGPRPRSKGITCHASVNASTFLAVVDTSLTIILETVEDTPESGGVEQSATEILEDGEYNEEHELSKAMTLALDGECSKPQVNDCDDYSRNLERVATLESISDAAAAREAASCPPQEEMLRHVIDLCPYTRQDATDAIMPSSPLSSEEEEVWDAASDNETLQHFSYNRLNLVLDSMHPQLAPHIVVTPPEETWEDEYIPWENRVNIQLPSYLNVPPLDISESPLPLTEPYSYQPLMAIQLLPSFNATPPAAFPMPRRVFSSLKLEQSISFASHEHYNLAVMLYLQKALCKATFFVASDTARALRDRYDSQPNVLSELETPFTWTDPAEPILVANHRTFGATIIDSICPFRAPHIIINAPPPQPSQYTENNTTPYTQDAASGDRLIVETFSTEVINAKEDWDHYSSCASGTDLDQSEQYWDYEDSYKSSTVDLFENVTDYSRPGTPLPETPACGDDDRHFCFVQHDDVLEVESSAIIPHYGSIYGNNSPTEAHLHAGKPPPILCPMFYIDEDDDELPSLDGW
ncbi:hypothetical protein DXG01_006018 [Tephrocybe rancida]|nr:hypothetical protein DXG01_006018 [Tephrocybe rancida]